ncbi:hypothetical protein [Sphingomonas sp. NFR04]|jgi:hypothetical protein|uniref:hypothetical protein n=1 Tax=Sphingomonas sp. NFR04 TaxID=1566283 RepID=UPI00111352D3|nr:hypothetical protein [Sphingomonas sp. NFR04]
MTTDPWTKDQLDQWTRELAGKTDQELVDQWQRTAAACGDATTPAVEALASEMERRDIDF